MKLKRKDRITQHYVDMTAAGQEVAVPAAEINNADAEISEETKEKEIYVGLTSDSEETE